MGVEASSQRQVIIVYLDLFTCNLLINNNRATALKTYSRRVNKGFPPYTAKKLPGKVLISQESSAESLQRRVLSLDVVNWSHEDSPQSLPQQRLQQHESAFNTTSGPQRQALLEINTNQSHRDSPGHFSEQSRKGGSTSPTASPLCQRPPLHNRQSKHVNKRVLEHSADTSVNNNSHPANCSLQISGKDIVPGIVTSLPSKTRQIEHAAPDSSYTVPEERSTLESPTPHLDKPSKRRRQPDDSDSELPSGTKKVKRSSITSYFKPLPCSSSPLSTPSVTIISDNLETPSSPPTSPLSEVESPRYRKSRKKSRRNLSIKPSLPTVTMSYEEEADLSYAEVYGNTDDAAGVERAERFEDHVERRDFEQSRADNRTQGATTPAFAIPKDRLLAISQPTTIASQRTSASIVADRNDGASPTLSEIDHSVPHSKPIDIPGAKKVIKYIQQQFVNSKSAIVQCHTCGFTYNQTIASEVRQHGRWHRDYDGGNHPLKSFEPRVLWRENIDYAHRIIVGRRRTMKERLWFDGALVISQPGLGGTIPEDTWVEITDPTYGFKVPRYKIYAYTIDDDVVSVILAERISQAGAYYCGAKTHDEHGKLATPDPTKSQEYVDLDRSYPVTVSIDRIWTLEGYQRNGFATKLLDYVRRDFIPGLKLRRCQIAFSSPTTAGVHFATKYCGRAFPDCPFVIGVDDARVVVKNGKLVENWAPSSDSDKGSDN